MSSKDSFGTAVDLLTEKVHRDNKRWWLDLETGQPVKRNVGEMIALMHSELSEALEGDRKDRQSDHIEGFSGLEEEMADLLIRAFDFCGGLKLRIGDAFSAKMCYNRTREDHKREARLAMGGKKY